MIRLQRIYVAVLWFPDALWFSDIQGFLFVV